jgi:RNA polymerase sigma-70 factor (ECF subfamily)
MGQEEGDDGAARLRALRARDSDAWDDLYHDLYPRLRSFFLRRVGPTHAEDTVAETMTRALAGIDRYVPGPSGLAGWIFGIARHVGADHHRRTARQRAVPGVGTSGSGFDPPDEAAVLGDEHASLRAAFDRLSRKDQEVLELRVIAGLSAEQAAAVLGKRPGAVRMAQSRALAELRRILEYADA